MPVLPPPTPVAPQPAPLESLVIPSTLDGSIGANRATDGRAQIAATNDLDAIRAWLSRFHDTKTTFESYRKEAERLLLWSLVTLGKPLSSLTHEDCLRYQQFLADPQPAATWVAGSGREHPRHDERWRPFYGPLSSASQRQAIVILNALFSWLVQAGYLACNPLSLSRQRTKHAAARLTRYLEPALWQEVKDTIATLPRETDRARAHAYRARWLLTLLYLGGLRIAEVCANHGPVFCAARRRRYPSLVADRSRQRWQGATRPRDARDDDGTFALPPATGPERTALAQRRYAAGFGDWRNRSQ